MATIDFEHHSADILLVHVNRTPDETAFVAYLEELTRFSVETPRFGVAFMMVGDAALSSDHAKRQAAWLREHFDMLRARCWGGAFVLPSAIPRLVFTTIVMLQRPPYPYKVVATREQALAWLAQQRPAT